MRLLYSKRRFQMRLGYLAVTSLFLFLASLMADTGIAEDIVLTGNVEVNGDGHGVTYPDGITQYTAASPPWNQYFW